MTASSPGRATGSTGRAGDGDDQQGFGAFFGPGRHDFAVDPDAPIFVISVAAQLAGMHPQTLRQYDRLGLVIPGRTSGRGRRYSARHVAMLREVQRLSQEEGVNLAGIKRILELEFEVRALREQAEELAVQVDTLRTAMHPGHRVFAAGSGGDIVAVPPGRRPQRTANSAALVVWRPRSR